MYTGIGTGAIMHLSINCLSFMKQYIMFYGRMGAVVVFSGTIISALLWMIWKLATFDYCPMYYGVKCLI